VVSSLHQALRVLVDMQANLQHKYAVAMASTASQVAICALLESILSASNVWIAQQVNLHKRRGTHKKTTALIVWLGST
jgi:hypothetical protein